MSSNAGRSSDAHIASSNSLEPSSDQLEVTCKTGPDQFKKHFLGISDNVTCFSEQVESAGVSVYRYRVIFKPQTLASDIDPETSGSG